MKLDRLRSFALGLLPPAATGEPPANGSTRPGSPKARRPARRLKRAAGV
jgi:hypothetical protein